MSPRNQEAQLACKGSDGERWSILYAGGASGWVPGSLFVANSTKKSDYHKSFNGPKFLKWFSEQLLPNLQPHSVIILDNASYHRCLQKWPKRKAEWRAHLQDHGITAHEFFTIADMKAASAHITRKSLTEEAAKALGHTILWLPPNHPQLNPIEMAWSQVKGFVTRTYDFNNDTKVEFAKRLHLGLDEVTLERWAALVRHCVKVAEGMVSKAWMANLLGRNTPMIIEFDGPPAVSESADATGDAAVATSADGAENADGSDSEDDDTEVGDVDEECQKMMKLVEEAAALTAQVDRHRPHRAAPSSSSSVSAAVT